MRKFSLLVLIALLLSFMVVGCDTGVSQTDLSPRVQTLESKVSSLESDNTSLKTQVAALETDNTSLESKVVALETSLNGLDFKILTGTTDNTGRFFIAHGVTNTDSIVDMTFSIKNEDVIGIVNVQLQEKIVSLLGIKIILLVE